MDVKNRGFGKNNTDFIIPVFEQRFPTRDEQQHVPKVRLLAIWFGATDAARPPSKQHGPLARYEANLASLVRVVCDPDSPRYSPDTRVVLLTPPPLNAKQWAAVLAVMTGSAGELELDRTLDGSRRYAEGAKAVAERESVAVVDVWGKI